MEDCSRVDVRSAGDLAELSGSIRDEVYSLPQTLAAGVFGVVTFRLGCSWLNNGTITARTDPSPVPGESNADGADNTRTVTFGSGVCS